MLQECVHLLQVGNMKVIGKQQRLVSSSNGLPSVACLDSKPGVQNLFAIAGHITFSFYFFALFQMYFQTLNIACF